MPNQPNNRTVMSVMQRTEKSAPLLLDRELMNELFAGALMEGLTPFEKSIKFEYTTDGVPESGKGIHSMYNAAVAGTDTFKVFDGANDAALLWFSPNVNLAYRALHDLDHAVQYTKGHGTTKLADELYLNCIMAKRAYKYAMAKVGVTEAEALMLFFCVYHDTVGQVYYYKEHNDFCTDQRANTEMLVQSCAGVSALKEGGVVLARLIMIGCLNTCKVHWVDV